MDDTPDQSPRDELDLALVEWLKDPSTVNESVVWRHLSPLLKRIAEGWVFRSRHASRESALDLAQVIATAFLENDRKILKAWDPERGVPAKAFFWLVATRKLQDYRRPHREHLTYNGELPEPTSHDDPESLLHRAKRDAAVRDFVELVATPIQLEIYTFVYERGISLEDTALELGKSADAIAAAHHRLKDALRRSLRLLKDDDLSLRSGASFDPRSPPPTPRLATDRPRTLRERLRSSTERLRTSITRRRPRR